MLKATRVELHLSSEDLEAALQEFAAGKVEELHVTLADRAVLVSLKVPVDRLPMAVPMELRFTVERVEAAAAEFGVSWSNLPLLPGFLKEKALQKGFAALPGEYRNSTLRLDVSELLQDAPVQFRLEAIEVDAEGVHIRLGDLAAFPVEPLQLASLPAGLVPIPSTCEAELPEHQDYYQKLRERITSFTEERAPRWLGPLVPWVLAVPDFFALMVRLARDERVPASAKVLAALAVAYFITPIDLIPDPLPVIGEVDDVAVALFAIEQIAKRVPAEVVQENWPGEGEVLALVAEGTRLFARVLPGKTLDAIRRMLAKEQDE
ncbi:MAG: YkvA family protein [Mycobacterium leprae]